MSDVPFSDERAALFGERESYPKPWRAAFHLSWFVVDANDGIVAGPFDAAVQAWKYVDAWKAGACAHRKDDDWRCRDCGADLSS